MSIIQLRKPVARDLSSVLNDNPNENIVMRCVDCQTFFLPGEITRVTARWRGEDGNAKAFPWMICPACHPELPKIHSWEDVPQCTFITLTKEQYWKTINAEKWNLTYNPTTNEVEGRGLIQTVN